MQLTSPAFDNNKAIPKKYTCDGDDINPPLAISDIPRGAKSLVLIVDDPDAPVGVWVHWTLWNISSGTKDIKEDTVPEGAVEGATSFGKSGYGGPCPPDGEHRYFFKIFALDTELNLSNEDDKEELEEEMLGHVIDKAELVGIYSR